MIGLVHLEVYITSRALTAFICDKNRTIYLFRGRFRSGSLSGFCPESILQWERHDAIMSTMASQITSLTIVYSTVYSRRRSKLRATGLCERNSPVTGEFPAQRASNAENVSIWWRHHGKEHQRMSSVRTIEGHMVPHRVPVTCQNIKSVYCNSRFCVVMTIGDWINFLKGLSLDTVNRIDNNNLQPFLESRCLFYKKRIAGPSLGLIRGEVNNIHKTMGYNSLCVSSYYQSCFYQTKMAEGTYGKDVYSVCFSHPCMFRKIIRIHLIV